MFDRISLFLFAGLVVCVVVVCRFWFGRELLFTKPTPLGRSVWGREDWLSTKRSPSVLDQFKTDPTGAWKRTFRRRTTTDDKVYSEPGKKRHNESQPRARLLTSSATQRPLESRAYSTTHHHKSRSPTFVSKISTTQKRENAKKSRGQRKETGFELAHQTDSC